MNPHAVPLAVLAGISGYSAILFLGLYVALVHRLQGRARREYLTFALSCAAVCAYDLACVALYNASSLAQGFFAMRCQLLTAAYLGVAYMTFIWDFLRARMPLGLRLSRVLLALLGPLVALWESPYTLTAALPAIKHVQVLGYDLIYYEVQAGLLDQLLMLTFFAVYLVNIGYLWKALRAGQLRDVGQVGIVIATVLSGTTAASDCLVTEGLYSAPYTFEYGIAAILMVMGYVLLMRFGALHGEVHALNHELQHKNDELNVALQLANESVRVKTEFLASISHELRTPLNAIINLPEGLLIELQETALVHCTACETQFELEPGEELTADSECGECGARALELPTLARDPRSESRARKCLQTVTRAGRHLLSVVNNMLDASKLELGRASVSASAFDPLELVHEVTGTASALASKRNVALQVTPEPPSTVPELVADRVKISQVLYNLIGNAIRFSPSDTAVEICVSAPSHDEHVICVRDHGIGIAKEHHGLIFERFRQVDGSATRAYGGAGLGLAISKGLVELHGGTIWVESERGQGAAFFVRLPSRPKPNA